VAGPGADFPSGLRRQRGAGRPLVSADEYAGAFEMADIGLFEAIYSARSLRRLKPDPVPDELITRILDAAIRALSAGNAQNWAFVVVRESEQRRQLGLIYRKASDIAEAVYAARGRPAHLSDRQFASVVSHAEAFN
jgi:Nitroreductase family